MGAGHYPVSYDYDEDPEEETLPIHGVVPNLDKYDGALTSTV